MGLCRRWSFPWPHIWRARSRTTGAGLAARHLRSLLLVDVQARLRRSSSTHAPSVCVSLRSGRLRPPVPRTPYPVPHSALHATAAWCHKGHTVPDWIHALRALYVNVFRGRSSAQGESLALPLAPALFRRIGKVGRCLMVMEGLVTPSGWRQGVVSADAGRSRSRTFGVILPAPPWPA